jgi:hypothetical protein
MGSAYPQYNHITTSNIKKLQNTGQEALPNNPPFMKIMTTDDRLLSAVPSTSRIGITCN